jgi:hypothetical protein
LSFTLVLIDRNQPNLLVSFLDTGGTSTEAVVCGGGHKMSYCPGLVLPQRRVVSEFLSYMHHLTLNVILCLIKGITAKIQMAKLCFCHVLASEHLIFTIIVPTTTINRELWGVGTKNMKIKCSEAKKYQIQNLTICIGIGTAQP